MGGVIGPESDAGLLEITVSTRICFGTGGGGLSVLTVRRAERLLLRLLLLLLLKKPRISLPPVDLDEAPRSGLLLALLLSGEGPNASLNLLPGETPLHLSTEASRVEPFCVKDVRVRSGFDSDAVSLGVPASRLGSVGAMCGLSPSTWVVVMRGEDEV